MFNPKQIPILSASASCCTILLLVSCVGTQSKVDVPASKTKKTFRFVPKIIQNYIPAGNLNRRTGQKMKPRYITIHSTANQSSGANAEAHVRLLHRAGLGNLSWHYTVDEGEIHQTLPSDEQGQHADYQGPGNRHSIGIEMCENEGNSREKTLDQTARLTAFLMNKHNIPISRVVPHQHWRRIRPDGKDFGHKNCPHFLMDNGKPGRKWNTFLRQIKSYQ